MIFTSSDGARMMDFWQDSADIGWRGAYPTIANVKFKNCLGLRFREWNTMASDDKRPVVTNCVFEGCTTEYSGAAVVGGAKIVDCKFLNCTANTGGAVVDAAVYDSHFEGCSAVNGGAVHWATVAGGGLALPVLSNCVFKANHTTANVGGAVYGTGGDLGRIIDCVFDSNRAHNGGGACAFGQKGDVYGMADIVDCVFTNNFLTRTNSGGGAIYCNAGARCPEGRGCFGCEFYDNISLGMSGGAVRNVGVLDGCLFRGNRCTDSNGGAVYADFGGYLATNCTFEGNMAERVVAGSYPYGGAICTAAGQRTEVTHCTFRGNSAFWGGATVRCSVKHSKFEDNVANAGAAMEECSAVKCEFGTNRATEDYHMGGSGGVRTSSLSECEVSCSISATSAERCVFRGINNANDWAVFYGANWVTNSLVTQCGGDGLRGIAYAYRDEGKSEFVNCTFAGNVSAPTFAANAGVGINRARAVNCAFFATTNASGAAAADLRFANVGAGQVELENCAYGTADEAGAAAWVNVDGTTFACADAKFADGGEWKLKTSSPLREKGKVMDWMADATDLAGNGRLRYGKCDVGCWECWDTIPGMVLVIR